MAKFKKGVVTNPAGRPKGSGSKQKLFREYVLPELPDLVKKAVQMAKSGDSVIMKFLLERGLPIKTIIEPLEIHGATVEQTTKNLLQYVDSGDLTPDEASKLAAIVQKDAEIKNQLILIEKISGLEGKLDNVGKMDINLNTEVKANGQEMDK